MSKKIKAFTLTEIIVVVIIVGITAAFGIPNYSKAIQRADERNMITNLKLIRAAAEIYIDADGAFPGPGWATLDAVNTGLGLSIIDPKAAYECGVGGETNECRATLGGWGVHFHDEHSSRKLHCVIALAPCPTCPDNEGDCE